MPRKAPLPCQGDVCHGEDSQQVTFFMDNEEYYDALNVASNIHHSGLDQDERYWSIEDEDVDKDIHSEVPGVESDDEDKDQEGQDNLDHEEKVGGEEAYKEEAEFIALSNLADSLPDSSSEKEDLAMETDPRHLIS